MDSYHYILMIGVSILISYALIRLLSFVIDMIKNRPDRLLNPTEYFPEEEVKTLKQVYYLILIFTILLTISNFFFDNNILLSNNPEFYAFNSFLDIIVSIYIATILYREDPKKNAPIILFLLPLASITYLIFGESLVEYWDFLRIPALLFLIKHLYDKFKSFTDEHSLGISIILLFSIILFSVITTIILENKDPLDAIVMVSNAFTSNGYAILGTTPGGKINSVILVWSGYIISGAATATLTAAILIRNNRQKLDDYNEKLEAIQSSIDEIKEELKNRKD
ncbi:MAG: hypothetical protein IKE95_05560 [Methanobrevibacter sp.]|nr:hypothetical protein [Methanobrevibacter sp.]